jgi:hypothetical protein
MLYVPTKKQSSTICPSVNQRRSSSNSSSVIEDGDVISSSANSSAVWSRSDSVDAAGFSIPAICSSVRPCC